MKIHNFSAGPSILNPEVIKDAAKAVLDIEKGLSLLEISHRSKTFVAIMDETLQLTKELLQVPTGYHVLYLQGGASTQFGMVPMNLLPIGGKAAYLDSGNWASKAIEDAVKFGEIDIVASSKKENYTHIPKSYKVSEDNAYFHYCANNTIYGTEMHYTPDSPITLVSDMSSNIFSRPIDVSKFGLIYGGAQKNLGPAGATLVIVREDILGKSGRVLPNMLDYKTHIKKESMYNTPPTFTIYVCLLTLRWLASIGGVEAMEKLNVRKADLLYNEIDRNSLFYGTVAKEDRSRMNICFRGHDETVEKEFLAYVEQNGISGIKGYRDVGGFRASTYNALPYESVAFLVELMQQFEKKGGK
jgi:phosphoserine aminotransferase